MSVPKYLGSACGWISLDTRSSRFPRSPLSLPCSFPPHEHKFSIHTQHTRLNPSYIHYPRSLYTPHTRRQSHALKPPAAVRLTLVFEHRSPPLIPNQVVELDHRLALERAKQLGELEQRAERSKQLAATTARQVGELEYHLQNAESLASARAQMIEELEKKVEAAAAKAASAEAVSAEREKKVSGERSKKFILVSGLSCGLRASVCVYIR